MLGDVHFLQPTRRDKPEVTIPAVLWRQWEDLFCDTVCNYQCLRTHKTRSYVIIDPDGWSESTPWGRTKIITLMFPDEADFLHHFISTQSHLPKPGSEDHSRICQDLFLALRDSSRVRLKLKKCAEDARQQAADILTKARDLVMMDIRVAVDNELGLPVKFVISKEDPKVLYYTYGENLFVIRDILRGVDVKVELLGELID